MSQVIMQYINTKRKTICYLILTCLVVEDLQASRLLSYFGDLTDVAQASFEIRHVAGAAEGTFLVWFSSVDGLEGVSAQRERIVLIIAQFEFIGRVRITCLQDLPRLLGYLLSWS